MGLFEFRLSRSARPLLCCRRRFLPQTRRPSSTTPGTLLTPFTRRVSHGLHGYVARGNAGHRYVARDHAGHRHYVWRNGHRYVYGYGYNPGAAVAGGVIAGAAAGYPYCGVYGSYYGSCDDYSYGDQYPYYDYDYGFGGPVFFGGDRFHHGFHNQGFGFHGNGAHFAGGNFGHVGGFGGGHVGGFGGGGFGGGHMGGFGGGHFGGGGHFR